MYNSNITNSPKDLEIFSFSKTFMLCRRFVFLFVMNY